MHWLLKDMPPLTRAHSSLESICDARKIMFFWAIQIKKKKLQCLYLDMFKTTWYAQCMSKKDRIHLSYACVCKKQKEDSTARSREVAQPSTDVARDCLISRFGVELDVSSRVWPLQKISLTLIRIHTICKIPIWYHMILWNYIIFWKIIMCERHNWIDINMWSMEIYRQVI